MSNVEGREEVIECGKQNVKKYAHHPRKYARHRFILLCWRVHV